MRFSCDSCDAQYMISDEKVGPGGVRVRCKKCGNVIPVRRAPEVAPEIASASPTAYDGAAAGNDGDLDRELGRAFDTILDGGSDAREWYVAIDDRQVGPMAPTGVRTRWESGEIGPDTLAWRSGLNDWTPLSSIPELVRYLGAARPAPVASEATPSAGDGLGETPPESAEASDADAGASAAHAFEDGGGPALNGSANGHDASWRPSAAATLAALASEEIASRQKPPAGDAGSGVNGSRSATGSLADQLGIPEGGVDPTHLVPLPMNGIEPTTEVVLKRLGNAPERTEIRQLKKSATRRGALFGVAVAGAVACVLGGVFWWLRPVGAPRPRTAGQPSQALVAAPSVPPRAEAPAPPPPVAVQQPPTAAASGTPEPATSSPSVAPPHPASVAAETPPAVPRPAPEPPHETAATPPPEVASVRSPHHAKAKREHANHATREPERVASAARPPEPPPSRPSARTPPTPVPAPAAAAAAAAAPVGAAAPAPPKAMASADATRKKPAGDPLLDVGGDDELEKELSGNPSKRSVYVPPAIGTDLPASVSVSQINEAVVGQKTALLHCIEQQRATDPQARGTLKLRWIIAGDGTPRDVQVMSDEFARQPIGACISGVVKGIRFPRSRTSGQEVVFPFKF